MDYLHITGSDTLTIYDAGGDTLTLIDNVIVAIGEGGGAVISVNGMDGDVVLAAADVHADPEGAAENVREELQDQIDTKADAVAVQQLLNLKADKVTTITAGTYGSATKSVRVTFNSQGLATSVTELDIAGGGGGPVVGNAPGQVPAVNGGLILGVENFGFSPFQYNDGYRNFVVGDGSTMPYQGVQIRNMAVGEFALNQLTSGSHNISFGYQTLQNLINGTDNLAFGRRAGSNLQFNYSNNIFIGKDSNTQFNASYNVCIGIEAGANIGISGVTNVVLLGYQSHVTGSNQVQLGNSGNTVYAFGAVQDRSDMRDKTDIQDCDLGLDFIKRLRPVKYLMDYREDYAAKLFPMLKRADFDTNDDFNAAKDAQNQLRRAWYSSPVKDGSLTRERYHYGVIAQDVESTLNRLGIDWGGFQDHAIKGGEDVKSIGYTEFIAPMLKAIQQLSARVEALELQLQQSA